MLSDDTGMVTNKTFRLMLAGVASVAVLAGCGSVSGTHPSRVVDGVEWGEPNTKVACFSEQAFLMTEDALGWPQYSRWESMDSVCLPQVSETPNEPNTGVPSPFPVETENPGDFAGAAELVAPSLVGLKEKKAEFVVEQEGLRWRVVERDGIAYPVTQDYVPTRINAVVEGNVVTETFTG